MAIISHIEVRGEEYDIYDKTAARIDSPEFTGIPLAPTADADTDSPQIATTAFVQRAVKDKFGEPGGIATLDENGKVPTSQLPSYVDDVLEGTYDEENNQFLDIDGNIYTPESDKIYVDVNTNTTYRWSGTLYIKIGGGSDEVPDSVIYIDPDETSSDLPDIDAVTNAKYVSYNNADSNLEATNVQDAIDELKESIGSGSGETVNIVDNLESTSADSALSANQGRVLKESIDEVNTYLQRKPSKNLLKITIGSGFSELGVTFTVNEDKSLTLSGTRTGFTKSDQTIGKANLKAGTEYILSGCPEGGSGSTYRLMVHNDANPSAGASDIGEGVIFTVPSDGEYRISTVLAVSYAYDGITYYPMIREATVEDDTYEPYYEDAMKIVNNALVHGDVVDNCLSNRADLPLSAKQGRVLNGKILDKVKVITIRHSTDLSNRFSIPVYPHGAESVSNPTGYLKVKTVNITEAQLKELGVSMDKIVGIVETTMVHEQGAGETVLYAHGRVGTASILIDILELIISGNTTDTGQAVNVRLLVKD